MEFNNKSQSILEIKNLSKGFPVKKNFWGQALQTLKAVTNVNLDIKEGECLTLVGESGCGKSTLARLILRLIQADGGEVIFQGQNILELQPEKLRLLRTDMQMIFQNPFSSLDPRYKVYDLIAEPLQVHKRIKGLDDDNIKKRVFELLELVDLDKSVAGKFPHQCSGGQNQRVGIARALALNPKLIVADEAVSALDVSIQWKVLHLIKKLQKDLGISFLFIAHNLGVVKYIADRVAVMYLGEIVEIADKDELFNNPLHPYTIALLNAAPVADPNKRNREKIFLKGEIPKATDIPSGCPFHTRCPVAIEECARVKPKLETKINKHSQHFVSCIKV